MAPYGAHKILFDTTWRAWNTPFTLHGVRKERAWRTRVVEPREALVGALDLGPAGAALHPEDDMVREIPDLLAGSRRVRRPRGMDP